MSGRSLNKVYDAIDSQNYRGALKLCDQLLRKNPAWEMVHAMKALVLFRLRRHEDAALLCAEIEGRGPTEEAVLNMMVHVYKAGGRAGDAIRLFESAWAKDTENVELAEGVFFCHARNGSYGKQQMAAMKMYKSFGEEKYMMWAVVSTLLQVQSGGEPRLLILAEMMLRKSSFLLSTYSF